MSRSYAMQDIINTISSGEGSKILREYPDFLITHWFRPAHDNYKIAASFAMRCEFNYCKIFRFTQSNNANNRPWFNSAGGIFLGNLYS